MFKPDHSLTEQQDYYERLTAYNQAPGELTELACEQMQVVIDQIGEEAAGELTFDEFCQLIEQVPY